jgi:hypothetical protein
MMQYVLILELMNEISCSISILAMVMMKLSSMQSAQYSQPCSISKIYQYSDILANIRFPKYTRNTYLWQKSGTECQRLLRTD